MRSRKKVRGLKRKCKAMIRKIENYTFNIPQKNSRGYWHLHLPVAENFIDSTATPGSVRRLYIQKLIERIVYLINIREDNGTFSRIVAAISLPKLWDSQIIIFNSQEYFESFFETNYFEQGWVLLPSSRDFKTNWSLEIPRNLKVEGYKAAINSENYSHSGEIWFIGEL
ncbi:hypothetical protein Desaci_1521 [Desulfosporosinus acidiphilus SJ4]|uniref:DUF3916 domain-containing protein n=1 Tax=Desulfosporosinus acidiphilus (strain DSM 22704 / JCM 16185 / SJ4) TaxID=646529 RepID=I4D408_DESAJ|nr:DUF3916 domain-containing protein [Desulfosporosinus acidiphilus]AFM40532.1 hypothetical protein Desaci_1521 [Desulfosporosinus acidiphilus SJ4]